MARRNTMLCLGKQGFTESVHAATIGSFNSAVFQSFGDVDDPQAIDAAAQAQFATLAYPQRSIVAKVLMREAGAMPFDGLAIGQTIVVPTRSGGTETVRVIGVHLSEDANGVLQEELLIETRAQALEELNAIAIAQMTPGSIGGKSAAAFRKGTDPRIYSKKLDVTIGPTMSWGGTDYPQVGDISPPWSPKDETVRLTDLAMHVRPDPPPTGATSAIGDRDVSIEFIKHDGFAGTTTVFQTEILAAGTSFEGQLISGQYASPLDAIYIRCSALGSGTVLPAGLVVDVYTAPVSVATGSG